MATRVKTDPSPLRTALVHGALSLSTFTVAGAALAGAVHVTGDANDASPRVTLAIFDDSRSNDALPLKSRFAERDTELVLASAKLDTSSLAIQRPDGPPQKAVMASSDGTAKILSVSDAVAGATVGQGAPEPVVRINGKAVPNGMSLGTLDSQTRAMPIPAGPTEMKEEAPSPLAPAPIAGLRLKVGGRWLPQISPDGRSPADAYARPSSVGDDTPKVAIIIGGLGINHATTLQAIEDLPADITLSFAPRRSNRDLSPQYYIDRARADGHEVLLEVPMEPYEWGRRKPEPFTLKLDASTEDNLASLYATLSKASGYIGIVNYQGAKFATDLDTVSPIVDDLASRGLVLVEDGSLPRSTLDDAARGKSISYRKASSVIDAEITAEHIARELARLESEALETGSALGTGFAFPVTVDTVLEWRSRLEAKGIAIVPASAVIGASPSAEAAASTEPAATPALPADGGKAG